MSIHHIYLPLGVFNKCVFNLTNPKERPKRIPFILEPISGKHYTLMENELRLSIDEPILIKCDFYDGTNRVIVSGSNSNSFYPMFNCTSGNKLKYQSGYNTYEDFFYNINCQKSQIFLHEYDNINEYENSTCEGGVRLAISYTANMTDFLQEVEKVYIDQIAICFDKIFSTPIYTHMQLRNEISETVSAIGGYVHLDVINTSSIKTVNEEKYLPPNIDYLFGTNYMNTHLNSLLGNNMFGSFHQIIPVNLIDENDVPILLHESVDSRLLRIPMWNVLANENWKVLRQDIRSLSLQHGVKRTIDVYTGTFGILTLPDSSGIPIRLYLQDEPYYGLQVPVPEYVWNVVYEMDSQKAVAFIAYNNPYTVNVSDNEFCQNVCNKIQWLRNFDYRKVLLGPIFCCELEEFRKVVRSMPILNNGDIELLTK